MTLKDAASNRHIIVNSVEPISLKDYALILDKELKSKNYNLPTTVAPNWYFFVLNT